jgi:hemerythrin
MPSLVWSDALALSHPEMDATHLEFVQLLGATEEALQVSPAAGLARYLELVEHTVAHFGQEDRWMTATGFATENCHGFQHSQVLGLMHEVTRLARDDGDFGPLERVLPELGKWFEGHAQTMDAALASHLQQIGFDPATGQIRQPLPAAQAPISGCGGSSCSTPADTEAA